MLASSVRRVACLTAARGRFVAGTRQLSSSVAKLSPEQAEPSIRERVAPILEDARSRLFAVVYVNDRQWKVTAGDVIELQGSLPLEAGDRIKLEKVLAIGSADFSIFGRPMLDANSVQVEAEVVERSHTYPELYYRNYNHYQTRITSWRSRETALLQIRSIRASPSLLSEHSTEDTKEATAA